MMLRFYFASIVLCALSFLLVVKKSKYIWKIKHPNFSFPKLYWTDGINTLIKAAFIIVCPVLNLMYSFVFITKYGEICEKTVSSLEKTHGL